ncbi:peptidase propeptide and YpeB domain protein [Streptomyces sp. Tu 2975]|uniref:PepSY domain-containing protein n=1 Tax=Streptomyces sp. Tu 2975 TaxID=2676871 RepID=UPI001359A585|nr:PepSY domain-containing protein [Streptomyces sp. Tu 2975]QIP84608.1 peptidase propeptide and YpeB domain protein [Streptomyces sp. Tu 2975]
MKRKLVIATVAAAVLIGGGTYTAAAVADDDASGAAGAGSVPVTVQDRDDDASEDRSAGPAGSVTAAQAVAAALKHTQGTVSSVDLDDDGDRHWEVDVLGKDDRERELHVDVRTGAVREDKAEAENDDRDDDRAALRAASVDAREAVGTALRSHPGATVTSVDFENDGAGHWEVELGDDAADERELTIDAKTASVSTDPSDD